MRHQHQPKTIDDYKDVVRILKLKIIKQNKRIQELQLKNKNYEEQINSVTLRGDDVAISSRAILDMETEVDQKKDQREIQLTTLIGKVEVMNVFVKGLKKLGITPESVFRIADIACKGFVESDYFRQILTKIKLGLTQKEISCLIFIFDQSYSGFITRQQYINSLYAYKLGIQDSYHQYIHQCIFKLSQMMHQDKINLLKFYQEMEGRAKNKTSANKKIIDLNVYEEQIKKYYVGKITEKQIVASFNAIDLQSQGSLQKNNFMYTITSFINKFLTGEEVLSKKTQNQWSNMRSQLTEPFQPGSPTKKIDKVIDNYNQSSKIGDRTEGLISPSEGMTGRLKSQYGIDLSKIYQQICMYDFKHRLTLKSFKRLCSKVNDKLNSQFLSQFYKDIDTQFKGSIYFNELINYYLKNSNDADMILRLLGKYFSVSDLNSQKFWFMFSLDAESEITKNGFMEIMKKSFQSKDGKLWESLWFALARDRDACNIGAIIKQFQKYECQI